jgi:replicative superfamily II helicase
MKKIKVIFSTGSLALGINTPCRTTIFAGDSPYLNAMMYRQMSGRAGRRGFDLRGNVIFYGLAMSKVKRLLLSRLPDIACDPPVTIVT